MKREYSKGGVTKNHGHWRAYVSYTDGDGTRRMLTMQTPVACREKDNSGRTAALEHQRRWRDGLVREEERREESLSEALAARSELPFYDYAKDFLDHHAVAEVTEKGYRGALNILKGTPAGECPIGELTSDLLLDLEGQARAEGRKGSTLAKRRAFYAMVLKRAVTRGDIPSNPLEGVRAPRAGRKPVNSLDLEGQEAVLQKVEELGWEPVTIAARIALLTGMRRGEICALRWQDVDFSNSIVHVNHALTQTSQSGGFRMAEPKPVSGSPTQRQFPIGPDTCRWLKTVRRRQRASGLDFVLTGSRRWFSPDVLTREWRMLAKTNGWRGSQGEPVVFHDLRHTFATIALNYRLIDVVTLAKILGHKNASMTLDIYATGLEDSMRRGMESYESLRTTVSD